MKFSPCFLLSSPFWTGKLDWQTLVSWETEDSTEPPWVGWHPGSHTCSHMNIDKVFIQSESKLPHLKVGDKNNTSSVITSLWYTCVKLTLVKNLKLNLHVISVMWRCLKISNFNCHLKQVHGYWWFAFESKCDYLTQIQTPI